MYFRRNGKKTVKIIYCTLINVALVAAKRVPVPVRRQRFSLARLRASKFVRGFADTLYLKRPARGVVERLKARRIQRRNRRRPVYLG